MPSEFDIVVNILQGQRNDAQNMCVNMTLENMKLQNRITELEAELATLKSQVPQEEEKNGNV